MTRRIWVLWHRYAGLAMSVFLIVVGLTGSLLAFENEINRWLAPHLYPAHKPALALKLGDLALKAQALLPKAEVKRVYVDENGAAIIRVEPYADPATGEPYDLGFNELFLDSGTGKELGRRTVGGLPTGLDNLMPFLYRLHYNLSLDRPGSITLGIVALAWTVDCFIAFYLTLPKRKKIAPAPERLSRRGKGFWQRWKPAWLIKWQAGATRINFDLHRAGGLWLWLMLLVFAWSSVGFNLRQEVYYPVMRVFFDLPETVATKSRIPSPDQPAMDWSEAQETAERLMAEQAKRHGFTIEEPIALYRQLDRGRYHYRVRSSLDIKTINSATAVDFDPYSGRLLNAYIPSGHYSGHTVTQWLFALHEANVFGLPYRILVCVLGLAIVMLSVTGILIWLKKRRRKHQDIRLP